MFVFSIAVLTLCMLAGDARLVKDIKLFDVVDLSGVNETTGYHPNSKAYEFTENTGALVAFANVSTQFAKDAFAIKQFTVKAYLLPASNSKGGTIVFFSRGTKKGAAFNVIYKWKSDTSLEVGSEFYIRDSGNAVSCKFNNVDGLPRNEWVHLDVRVHTDERLIRCEIRTASGRTFHRYAGKESNDSPMDRFPLDGKLRLAQQLLSVSEHLLDISERFIGKLQDVIISFGDPNCTIIINDTYTSVNDTDTAVTSTPKALPTTCPVIKDDTCLDVNGVQREDGKKWTEGNWVKCDCNKGKTYCVESVKRCLSGGKDYREGDTWDDSNCDRCVCKDGVANCESSGRTWTNGCDRKCGDGPCNSKKVGCFCSENQFSLDGKCVDLVACPCKYNGKRFSPGQFRDGCNLCLCSGGKTNCFRVYC